MRHFIILTQETQCLFIFRVIYSNKWVRKNKFILTQSHIFIINSTWNYKVLYCSNYIGMDDYIVIFKDDLYRLGKLSQENLVNCQFIKKRAYIVGYQGSNHLNYKKKSLIDNSMILEVEISTYRSENFFSKHFL